MTFTSRALDAAGVAGPAAAQQANVLWFIPTHGEGRYLATIEAERDVSLP